MQLVEIVSVKKDKNSCFSLEVRVDRAFKSWFCQSFELKRWSKKKFQKVFLDSLSDYPFFKDVKSVKVIVS